MSDRNSEISIVVKQHGEVRVHEAKLVEVERTYYDNCDRLRLKFAGTSVDGGQCHIYLAGRDIARIAPHLNIEMERYERDRR